MDRRRLRSRRVAVGDPLIGKLYVCCGDVEVQAGDAILDRRHGVWDVILHFACVADAADAAPPDLIDMPSVEHARAALRGREPRRRRRTVAAVK